MMNVFSILLFFVGFVFLIKGSDVLINGASSIAKRLKVSPWVIGLTIVGIGTSLSELIIGLLANLKGESDITFGVVIGSNIVNMLLILGLAASITPLILKKEWVRQDLLLNFLAILIIMFFVNHVYYFDKTKFLGITRLEGGLLFTFCLIWLYYLTKRKDSLSEEASELKIYPWFISFVMLVGGLIAVIVGGDWVVDGALVIAKKLNISEGIIGLTIISIGSSLPELFITVVAAVKRNIGLAVGNIIGSNIFDFLGILGVSALIRPIAFSPHFNIDLFIVFFSAFLLFVFAILGRERGFWERIFGKKYIINRYEGIILVILYILYIYYLLLRAKV